MKTQFLYSVGLAGFALLNEDGSMPTACDWKDVDNVGNETTHTGGIIGKAGPFDVSKVDSDNSFIDVFIGNNLISKTFFNKGSHPDKITLDEVIKELNDSTLKYSIQKGYNLVADKVKINGIDHLRISNKDGKIPFYTPIGLHGVIPQILGVQGYLFTEEVKSVKSDFEKESGKSVDVTSGKGIRCVVKEADKIKGLNLTISMAGSDLNILSMITGHKFNVKEDSFFVETGNKAPTFAFIYFVKAFEKGENNESSFTKAKAVMFPSCQATLPGDNAQEGAFATMELQASCSANKQSKLPMMFYKGVDLKSYSSYIELI